MTIYLMQHAQAVREEVDQQRPLSEEGRATIGRVAARVARLGLPIEQVYHSGKLRARQTAEALATALPSQPQVHTRPDLNPKDPAAPLARWLRDEAHKAGAGELVVVGHLPLLEKLASLLLTGDENAGIIAFQYAGLVALIPKEGGKLFAVRWILTPELA
jgi:phosphohistidine phosphatase